MLNRQRVSANGFLSPYAMDAPALGMDGPYYTEATVGLFAGTDLDLWGVHRSSVAAAIGAHNAALAETAAVELSLTTGVAQLYYSIQASYQMLDLLEQTHDVIDYAVKAHQSKVAHGPKRKYLSTAHERKFWLWKNKLPPSKGKLPKPVKPCGR